MDGLCRDCGSAVNNTVSACPHCAGHRLIRHPEISILSIAHIDCDAFYAAIEKRDDPSLADKPVLVGGSKRGVVATCCYIARLYGVHSAMPMFKALKACPHAVVISPNGKKYSQAAAQIREKMRALTPLVQPVSIDEAYLDLSGTTALHQAVPALSLIRLAKEIETDVGITVSIGLSVNKLLAKTASELDKPRGFAMIGETDALEILGRMRVQSLHGVGPKLARRLEHDGYEHVSDIQSADKISLMKTYGDTGQWLHRRAHGIDNRDVSTQSERKSVSSETTFFDDIGDAKALEDWLWKVCVRTADRAKAAQVSGRVVTLKLKTSRFKSLTRRVTLGAPTQLAQPIFRAALPLLEKETKGNAAYRLIGVGLSDLCEDATDLPDLLDPQVERRAAAERASDIARAKFGSDAVITGRAAKLNQSRKTSK